MIVANLLEPIPFFNKALTKIAWEVSYPSCQMYYQLQDDGGLNLKSGNWNVPMDIILPWGEDDSIITNAVLSAAPWIIIDVPSPEPAM